MTISIWLSLLLICLLGAMLPGPSLAVVAKHSLSGGRWHGIVCAWAHACGVVSLIIKQSLKIAELSSAILH